MDFPYFVVDVFTKRPLEGNALAVFPDARGLDTATMQRVARELNLSETTFIHPRSDAAPRVRIFTPAAEMEFAGHPTIGTAFIMRHIGSVSQAEKTFVLHENVGPVRVRVDEGADPILWLTTPAIADEGTFDRAACAAAVSLEEHDLLGNTPCELLSAGNPNLFIAAKDVDAVDRAAIDTAAFLRLIQSRTTPTCIFVFTPTAEGAYSRMFAPQLGIIEDPATGSATGPLAAFMMRHHLVSNTDGARFVSVQGVKMGRRSELHVLVHGTNGCDGIEIGGHVAHVARATMSLDVPARAGALG